MKKPIYSKVKAFTLTGGASTAVATILVILLRSFGLELPMEWAAAIAGALVTLLGGLAGYLKKEMVV